MVELRNVRVTNVETETEDDVQFGTCELCFYTSSLTTTTLTIEYELKLQNEYSQESFTMELGEWDYGEYEDYDINVIDFAGWLKEAYQDNFKIGNEDFKYFGRYLLNEYFDYLQNKVED